MTIYPQFFTKIFGTGGESLPKDYETIVYVSGNIAPIPTIISIAYRPRQNLHEVLCFPSETYQRFSTVHAAPINVGQKVDSFSRTIREKKTLRSMKLTAKNSKNRPSQENFHLPTTNFQVLKEGITLDHVDFWCDTAKGRQNHLCP